MKYNNIEQALCDVQIAKQNPDDLVFFEQIRNRVLNSSKQLQKDIQNYLEELLFETHPKRLIQLMAERYKGYVVVKKKKFFFEA